MTLPLEKLHDKFKETDNQFVQDVKNRFERIKAAFSDMPSAECKYHRDCYSCFLQKGSKISDLKGKRGRRRDAPKDDAFENLVRFLEQNDECQYQFSEIEEKMNTYTAGTEEAYSTRHLRRRLSEYFGEKIVISEEYGTASVVTFKEQAHKLLREKWGKDNANVNEKKLIIDMAASYIKDSIRSKPYPLDKYPDLNALDQETVSKDIPEELQWLLNGIITSKNPENEVNERRKNAISHAIISATRPRSFISSIKLSLAVYLHKKYESRELIDILCSLGFGESYEEVRRFIGCILCEPSLTGQLHDVPSNSFFQFVFDNADWNIRNATGKNSWHVMGGVASVSPGSNVPQAPIISRLELPLPPIQDRFIPLEQMPHGTRDALKKVRLKPLPLNCLSIKGCLTLDLDNVWLILHALQQTKAEVTIPGWAGFMKNTFPLKGKHPDKVVILPFALGKPSDEDTIYSCLKYAREECSMKSFFVTFDQPLYIKAIRIIEAFPNVFPKGLIKLGEFHMITSYLGCIGYIMAGSGLDVLWSTVYAKDSVPHMMTGHAYSRSLAAHLSTSAALMCVLLKSTENSSFISNIEGIVDKVNKGTIPPELLHQNDHIALIRNVIEEIKSKVKVYSSTAELWLQYLELVTVLKLFIASIRLGDMDTYQYCLVRMIPVFHAAGHLAYAKCTRMYLQQLSNCKNWMDNGDYERFFDDGKAVIRRVEAEWGGNETDKVIEQDLMRLIKSKGGLTRGRGISDSTMQRFTNALPITVPMCNSLEEYCNVHSCSSEQHKDLRQASKESLYQHIRCFVEWFEQHSPFPQESQALTNIYDGTVAEKNVNCHKAIEIGTELADTLNNIPFADAKLKRNDKVITMSTAINAMKFRGRVVEINPDILFHRICCVIEKKEEMEEFLKFELTQQPPSLFKEGKLRKNNKSDLARIIKSSSSTMAFTGNQVVIDGGHLLHAAHNWARGDTFQDICNGYVSYCLSQGSNVEVVFDGYGCNNSTKAAERRRRSEGKASKTYIFNLGMSAQTAKEAFLSNYSNKARLITFLRPLLEENGIPTKQSDADADYLVAQTALNMSGNGPTLCIATDTDILVMLVEKADESTDLYFGASQKSCYNVQDLHSSLSPLMQQLLVIIHGFSDNDTTSGFFNKAKKTIFDLVNKDPQKFEYLRQLNREDLTADEVASIGERMIVAIYKGKLKLDTQSLDTLRYQLYIRSVGNAKLTSKFELKTLPPTSDAARQHSLRVYITIQQWRGNTTLDPCEWGWQKSDDALLPVYSLKEPVPEKLEN